MKALNLRPGFARAYPCAIGFLAALFAVSSRLAADGTFSSANLSWEPTSGVVLKCVIAGRSVDGIPVSSLSIAGPDGGVLFRKDLDQFVAASVFAVGKESVLITEWTNGRSQALLAFRFRKGKIETVADLLSDRGYFGRIDIDGGGQMIIAYVRDDIPGLSEAQKPYTAVLYQWSGDRFTRYGAMPEAALRQCLSSAPLR